MSNNPYSPSAVGAGRPVESSPTTPPAKVEVPFPAPQPSKGFTLPESRSSANSLLDGFKSLGKLMGMQIARDEAERERVEEIALSGPGARERRLFAESLAQSVRAKIFSESEAQAQWRAKYGDLDPSSVHKPREKS